MKKCSICYKEYKDSIPHYCTKCGNNLSNQIEKTDLLLFFSRVLKILGLMGLFLFSIPAVSCALSDFCVDGACLGTPLNIFDIAIIFSPILLVILGIYLKKIFKKICLANIQK